MEKLIKHYKTQTNLAKAMNDYLGSSNIKTGHIYYWKKKGLTPKMAVIIEEMTGGLFNRRLLCPQFFNQ
jgi:hypothetical protein